MRRLTILPTVAVANLGSDDLGPLERPSDERRSPLLLWVATRYQRYWADQVVGSAGGPESEAGRSVAAMVKATRPGISAAAIAQAGLAVLSETARQSALTYGLGQGIGIELNGFPKINPRNEVAVAEGSLLSFRIFARGTTGASFASAIVKVDMDGAVQLTSLSR